MRLAIPDMSLVVMIGVSGAGKSTLARRCFAPTQVVSSDVCRGLVSDDENNQSATNDAFDVMHYIIRKRLRAGLLTVVDATNVHPEDRAMLVEIAREHHCLPVAIVMDTPERICQERNAARSDRDFGPHVIRGQRAAMRRSLPNLRREGFRHVFTIRTPEEAAQAVVERVPLWVDRRGERGPFDIIGDVHGCREELEALLAELGHNLSDSAGPGERKIIFLGDLCDRGPDTPGVYRLVMRLVREGRALCLPGNHDEKLLRKLRGKSVAVRHGLELTLAQLERETPRFREELAEFLDGLVSHYVLDGGRLVVAHAGLKEEMHGRASGGVREFALYGDTNGEVDEHGYPVRRDWAADYRGGAAVVYGHVLVDRAEWVNNTINIDTGCAFGGRLTALRYPERELVSVPAKRAYAERRGAPAAARHAPLLSAQQRHVDVLDAADVTGKRIIETALAGPVTIRAENAAAAFEAMSRFAADPRWLIYLPPTMSPCEASREPGLMEHPAQAFDYFRRSGVVRVVCEEKHMGSRAVVVVCKDEAAAMARFGIADGGAGICYTRTGRRFFDNAELEAALLERVRSAADASGLWERLDSDWMILDCELMPWSAKAKALITEQYAAVGACATWALERAAGVLEEARERGVGVGAVAEEIELRRGAVSRFVAAYRHYCRPAAGIDDYRLAPFHLLASRGKVHVDKDHEWHMRELAGLSSADATGVVMATASRTVELADAAAVASATQWWFELTGRGGEGMVVKPLGFVEPDVRSIVQPAVKCRGREYLRIIYGPDYDSPGNIERLRARHLNHKRALAIREFALGAEGLARFVDGQPLRRVHECVFGVLALESEPVDPRL
ncbi:MAG: polynucleotide kinase-phosphatase [Planctomycetes bacterium]|nr:polynucleotide kinase-phosphatase [Planctomycetota bacterium]